MRKTKQAFKKLVYVVLGLFLLFQIYVLIKIYWLTSCAIPTLSMSPTLVGGDYIIVSKQIPGRRIYKEDPLRPGYYLIHRKKGVRDVKKKDVVVFNFPYARNQDKMILSNDLFYCKRCVALPGEQYQWTTHIGIRTLYVPKVNDIVRIDTANYKDYYKCIEYETGLSTHIGKDGQIYLADSLLKDYRFSHNYYFICGDNTNDSYDSRYWGVLPDDFILGVGQFIWFSKDEENHQIRWNRIFRKI